METRKELKEIISELKDKLKEAQDNLEKLTKNERWKPDDGCKYWFTDERCKTDWSYYKTEIWCNIERYNTYNCFYTQEEAEREADKILIRRKLEDLARRLNGNEKIDWNDFNQMKYCMFYNYEKQVADYATHCKYRSDGTIYCLDSDFLYKAIEEIGKEELISYIKGE